MQSILIAVDLSEISRTVVDHAMQMADPRDSDVHLLHVTLPNHYVPSNVNADALRSGGASELCAEKRKLHEMAEEIRGRGYQVTTHQVPGNASHTILAMAGEIDADQIVMGTHRHSDAYHLLMGGIGSRVKRRATCPVMLVPPAAF